MHAGLKTRKKERKKKEKKKKQKVIYKIYLSILATYGETKE